MREDEKLVLALRRFEIKCEKEKEIGEENSDGKFVWKIQGPPKVCTLTPLHPPQSLSGPTRTFNGRGREKKFGKSSGPLVSDTVTRSSWTRYLNVREEGGPRVRHPSRISTETYISERNGKYSIVSKTKFSQKTKFGEITAKQLFLPSATFVFRATNPDSTRAEIHYEVGGGKLNDWRKRGYGKSVNYLTPVSNSSSLRRCKRRVIKAERRLWTTWWPRESNEFGRKKKRRGL